LASGEKQGTENLSGSEVAELTRDILSALAHELGGIASALDLRAHVLSNAIPPQDLAALRDLAEELRVATRAIRLVRGPDGSGTLNPSRRQTLAEWWRMAARFVAVALPRGTALETRFAEGELTASQASDLLLLLLAACKELAERGIITPCTISIVSGPLDKGSAGVTLVVEVPSDRVSPADPESRWAKYAEQAARKRKVTPPTWETDASLVRWRCTVVD
jgi:hypothetical protein